MTSRPSLVTNDKIKLAMFYWLIEDWQGLKQEIRTLKGSLNYSDNQLLNMIQTLLFWEWTREVKLEREGWSDVGIGSNELIKEVIYTSVSKSVLKSKFLLDYEVNDKEIESLMSFSCQINPTKKLLKVITETILTSDVIKQSIESADSTNEFFENLKLNKTLLDRENLLQAVSCVENLSIGKLNKIEYKKIIAENLVLKQNYSDANKIYLEIVEVAGYTEYLSLRLAQTFRNMGDIKAAIAVLDSAIKNIGRSPSVLHTIALYCRDNQNFIRSLDLVREIIEKNIEYSRRIKFAIFAADIYRKNADYTAAYRHLRKSVEHLITKGDNIPLIADAMLKELEANVLASRKDFFEVSSVFYDAIYEKSDKYSVHSRDSIYEPAWQQVCCIIEEEALKRVIDIGCGPGQFAEYLSAEVPRIDYLGLDFSATAIQLARRRCPELKFERKDVREYLSEGKNDEQVYVLLEVLEHIEDDIGLLNLLPEGSKVIFSVPNFDSFGHVRFFQTREQLIERFEGAINIENVIEVSISCVSKIFIVVGVRL